MIYRAAILAMVSEEVLSGARQEKACAVLKMSSRTYQRWKRFPNCKDGLCGPLSAPSNNLSEGERNEIIRFSTSAEFHGQSHHQIVPTLADRGLYVASESSFYRVLREEKLLNHRGKSKPRNVKRPRAYQAVRANQIYSWDITYLKSVISRQYFYLYLFFRSIFTKDSGS